MGVPSSHTTAITRTTVRVLLFPPTHAVQIDVTLDAGDSTTCGVILEFGV